MPELWISLFQKLKAPLKIVGTETMNKIRIRRRDVSTSHALGKLLGKIMLSAMDIGVNHETGMLPYRLHDQLWIVGDPQDFGNTSKTIQQSAAVMGLICNKKKTGAVRLTNEGIEDEVVPKLPDCSGLFEARWNHWRLDNQKSVDAHIKHLRKQPAACRSLCSELQTWNSCIGRFFQNTCGLPINCFGRQHLNSIFRT